MPRFWVQILAVTTILTSSLNIAWAETDLSNATVESLIQQAEQDNLQAQVELATRYFKGDGVNQDLQQAAKWYQKLADKEVADAQLTLGLMYIRGDGVQQDNKEAIKWLTRAAEQRIPTAQYLLGVAHEEGHGVDKNLVTALMWYEIAASVEFQNAIDARTAVTPKLTSAEIQKAEKMATDWWMRFHH